MFGDRASPHDTPKVPHETPLPAPGPLPHRTLRRRGLTHLPHEGGSCFQSESRDEAGLAGLRRGRLPARPGPCQTRLRFLRRPRPEAASGALGRGPSVLAEWDPRLATRTRTSFPCAAPSILPLRKQGQLHADHFGLLPRWSHSWRPVPVRAERGQSEGSTSHGIPLSLKGGGVHCLNPVGHPLAAERVRGRLADEGVG
jgi:hypothetical protein